MFTVSILPNFRKTSRKELSFLMSGGRPTTNIFVAFDESPMAPEWHLGVA